MNAVILTQNQFDLLQKQIEELKDTIQIKLNENGERIYDNEDFIERMHISKRTAQSWRDEGKISFSQVGNKIYYTQRDVDAFINKFKNKAFKR